MAETVDYTALHKCETCSIVILAILKSLALVAVCFAFAVACLYVFFPDGY